MAEARTAELLSVAAERAVRYLDGLQERGVAPTPEALAALDRLDHELPEAGADPIETIALLDDAGSPATVASAGPRFYGFVVGGSLPVGVAAAWLAGAWDQNAGMVALSPVGARLEEVAQRWLLDVLGLPSNALVGFVTGATMANLSGLATGRHEVLRRAGWDVEAQGLFGAPPVTVVVGDEVHPSVMKGLGVLGFGRERLIRVPVDGQGRMRVDAFPVFEGPAIVCLQAGNVNTGAVDPVQELIPLAHERGAWVHVDGAFGLWAAAAPSRAHLVRGIDGADSWATDAHKWLNVPYDSGLVIVRDGAALQSAMAVSAAYLPLDRVREPALVTPEMSRRARGVEVWAVLRSLGRQGLAELIERDCRHAVRFAEALNAAGYRILNDVVLNQVLVEFGDEAQTRRAIQAIQRDGTCWAGVTTWQGHVAMRISVSSWATTEADVERSIEAMVSAAAGVRATDRVS
ncbi:MAG TPA: aminotransferase class V-fold PLP-dependent enzyme [Thermoleophilia bacterium]|nr:aminotransferase class V-fold PLP-dependent enzyme [Thermoleophilia bacterium]